MKKITLLVVIAAIGFAGIAIAKVYAVRPPHPKPNLDDNICYIYSVVENDCVGSPKNCLCNAVITRTKLNQLNAAIANNTLSDFFSNTDNVQAFQLYPDQVQELSSGSCWVLQSTNQQVGKVFYAVGTSAVQNFDNADFILNLTPSGN